MESPQYYYGVGKGYQPILAEIGLGNSDAVFEHPSIRVWRTLADRENGTLDAALNDGRQLRFHVKRYAPSPRGRVTPGEAEAEGIFLLERAGIPTLTIAAWGRLPDRRSFVITEDLSGHEPADTLIEKRIVPFDAFRDVTADLAAKLHAAGLHHRDLYLCHFFARVENARVTDVKLIDAARVRMLPAWLFRTRWIVKDLAQFSYSAQRLGVDERQLKAWLARYAGQRKMDDVDRWRAKIGAKVRWIAKHDARLNAKQPHRNVSIPRGGGT
jgi:hypothetical protein